MSSSSSRALATAVAMCATPLLAQWQPVPTSQMPPVRTHFTFTPYNAPGQTGSLLLFGGDSANPNATEWLWDGAEWSTLTTPVPRRGGQAITQLANGDLLLFGGYDGNGTPLLDTWLCSNGAWTQLAPTATPPAMAQGTMIMTSDPAGGAILIGQVTVLRETWRFANGQWSHVNTAVPNGQSWTLFTDTVRGEVGLAVAKVLGIEIYGLVGGAWEQRSQPNIHLAFIGDGAFDPERGRLVLAQTAMAGVDTFEWDGASLTQAAHTFNFFATGRAIWHAARKEVLIAQNSTTGIRLWRWPTNPRPFATAYGQPCQDPGFTLDLAPGDSPEPGAVHRLQASVPNAAALTFSVLGFSHTTDNGGPLPRVIPFGSLGCEQRVQALVANLLPAGPTATQAMLIPNSASMLGLRYDAQFVQADAAGVLDASNGLEVQIGMPIADRTLTETFSSTLQRDAMASGDTWSNGAATAVAIGGDGHHGSFDPSLGAPVSPNHYEWNTDSFTIPAANTFSGVTEVVTDGEFHFTDFVLPAGVTVTFTGSAPPRIRVRGRVDVQGTLLCNAEALPFWVPTSGLAMGLHVSDFNARGAISTSPPFVPGQPGSAGGPGGGRGGDGGNECQGTGPIIIGGTIVTNGQPGQDVRITAGHAYAAFAAGTGGQGATMHPATGIAAPNTPLLGSVYRAHFAPGGGGGGFDLAGGAANVTPLGALSIGATPTGGTAFPVVPYPPNPLPSPGYSSLDHFVVGGSGGGGGATHAFGTIYVVGDVYIAGSGGSGGGGALALRAGGDLVVGSSASLQAKGGDGVLINGDDANTPTTDQNWGISSPGGGGSGGSLLLQAAGNVVVDGDLDTSGGPGSRTGFVANPSLNVQSQAGAGSNGFVRLEAGGAVQFTGSSVPAIVNGTHTGPLTDTDQKTGSRSLWMVPPSVGLPVYRRYELLADVNGNTLLFSDDPTVSTLRADDPAGPVLLRLQAARLDPLTAQVDPATIGPWRSTAAPGATDSLNRDRGTAVRFDLVLDKSHGPVRVLELRLIWR